MLRIAICDDEPLYIHQLTTMLKSQLNQDEQHLEIKSYTSGFHLIELISKQPQYFDCIFLDNLMPDLHGIELAKTIRLYNESVPLIFITSTKEYAFESYQVKASHYLLKPINETDVQALIDQTLVQLPQSTHDKLNIKTKHELHHIPIKNIYYFESHLRKIIAYTLTDNLIFYEKMTQLESRLPENQFIRCHQSYLVNVNYIKSIKNGIIILQNAKELPISKKYQVDVKDSFLYYLNQQFI